MINYDKENRKLQRLAGEREAALSQAHSSELERSRLYGILDGIMHETRRLNAEIANSCEEISKSISRNDYTQAAQHADDAFYKSGLVSSRLTFADFEINPDSLERQTKYSAGVYRKFDKARRILLPAAGRRGITIRLNGPSRNEIDVLPAFEMVPFVLVENAVKYSPNGQEVIIEVQDNPDAGCRVQAIVTSIGPIVTSDELIKLTDRGFRGSSALKSRVSGEGIGLYLANTLVRLANGNLQVSSSPGSMYSVDNVAYSEFIVTLRFK